MTNTFLNFNNVERQNNFLLIPEKTLAKVRLDIKQGGYNNEKEGWDAGMATFGKTGAVYLKCEYKILSGEYKGRVVLSLIGLHSEKSPLYQQIGRQFILGIIESSRGIDPNDNSEAAAKKRQLNSLSDLDNLTFVAEISVGKDANGNPKNEIKKAVPVTHSKYGILMDGDNLPF
jgi:hypothetical protein